MKLFRLALPITHFVLICIWLISISVTCSSDISTEECNVLEIEDTNVIEFEKDTSTGTTSKISTSKGTSECTTTMADTRPTSHLERLDVNLLYHISTFLNCPQKFLVPVNKYLRTFFMETRSFSFLIEDRFDLPGLRQLNCCTNFKEQELVWFLTAPLKASPSFIPTLIYAIRRNKYFPTANRAIIKGPISSTSNSNNIQFEDSIDLAEIVIRDFQFSNFTILCKLFPDQKIQFLKIFHPICIIIVLIRRILKK